jgi:anaerobic selenocysteine-containing dehydrogenase
LFDLGIQAIPGTGNELLSQGRIRNLFIFGEDPVGCETGNTYRNLIKAIPFRVVMDYFLTDTAREADLVLPASFPAEIGGTFSNTQKVLLEFDAALPSRLGMDSVRQLTGILKGFGLNGLNSREEVFREFVSQLPKPGEDHPADDLTLVCTSGDSPERVFRYGCDSLVKRFEEEFAHVSCPCGTQ